MPAGEFLHWIVTVSTPAIMKLTLALLATVVLVVSGNQIRGKHSRPLNGRLEQQWNTEVPEINQPKIQERTYKDGSEYRYLYDGQILTGMPEVHLQFSGARIRAVVKIQSGPKELMQIEKVFVGSLHERFVSEPQTLIQLDAFEPMQEQDAPFEEALKKPVRFTLDNGKIDNFESVEDDPSWSINIKRAILATFHLSLTEKEEPKDQIRREILSVRRSEQTNQIRSRPSGLPTGPSSNGEQQEKYFTVVEDGIAGRCEVSYLVLEQPDNAPETIYPIYENENQTQEQTGRTQQQPRTRETSVLNVTKTFDYRNCEYRPFVFQQAHLTSLCPTCESDPEDFADFLESAAHTRYNITGTRNSNYLIDSAITEAIYKMTPRSHFAGSLVAYTNITVVLIQSGPKTTPIQFPETNTNKIDGLHMINPRFVSRQGDKFLYETAEASQPIVQMKKYWPNVDEKPRKVKALVEKLVQGMEVKEIQSETATLVEHIVHLLEYAFDEELEQIHNEVKTINVAGVEKEEIEHLFADLLVSTGSNCTFTYLKKLLIEKKLQGPVVRDIFALLPFRMDSRKISPYTLTEMAELCQHESMKVDTFTERSCWLSFGTIVHKACGHRIFDDRVEWPESLETGPSESRPQGRPTPRPTQTGSQTENRQGEPQNLRCPAEVRRTIVERMTQKLKQVGEDDEKKILIIKVLGNMQLEETLDELAAIAIDESEPVYIRTQAIYAIKFFGRQEQSEEALRVLLPLYRESKNPGQVRIAAFLSILATKPDLPVLQDIAQSLNREVDLDVASFVYSSLSNIANSTDPCLKNVTRDALLALHLTTPVNTAWTHSKNIQKGAYLEHMKSGVFWESNLIMDKDAPAPRAGNFRVRANVNEMSVDIVEVGWETEGWGDMARKYFGNFTTENIADVVAGRAARRSRSADNLPVQSIDQIDRLLNFKPKETKEVRGSAYLKIFGQETRFVVINGQTVSRFLVDLITQEEAVLPKLMGEGLKMDNRRAAMLFNTKLEFPTVLGVPVGFNFRVPVVAGIKGQIKVTMEPKPASGFALFKQIPQQVTVNTDVKTSIAGEMHAKLSVYLGFLSFGTGIRTKLSLNMPLDGKVEFSLKDMLTKVTMNLPENPIKLVKMESYPLTYVQRFSKNSVTYQPKAIPQGLETRDTQQSDSTSSEEEQRQPGQPQSRDRFLRLKVHDDETEMMTQSGHVKFPQSFTGLPVAIPEIWEIATPNFVKSRDVKFQIGHESMAFKMDVESSCEYPVSRLAPQWLPVVGSKIDLEIKLTPKAGLKKVSVSVFERSEFSMQPEKELLNKLKNKVEGLAVKDLEKPNTPKDYEKFPKFGRSLQVLVNADGTDAPNAWTTRALLALIYSVDGRYMKLVAAMDSKVPILAKKISFNGELRYPDRNGLWFMTPQEALNKSIQGQAELFWGEDFSAEKQIKLRLRFQKTEEQTQIEKEDLYNVNGIPVPSVVAGEVREGDALFTSLFKQCEEDRRIGAFFSKECVDMAIRYADLLRLKIDVDYKNVSPSIRKVLHQVEWMVKGIYHWNTDVQDVDIKNPENKMSAVIDYSADRSYVDIKYKTPTQNVKIINLELPYEIQPASALFPWSPVKLVGLESPESCTISGPKINTFDDVSDFMPLSQCYHVMVKDASDDNLFAVLVANAAKNSLAKKVLVMFEGHRIEFIPKTGAAIPTGNPQQPIDVKSLYVVKYNGQVLADALTPEKRTTIPPNSPQDKQEVADIMLVKPESTGNKDVVIALISRVTGIKVLFDGSSVTVLPSPFWKNSLVGLCGTYDAQPWSDKLLPNMTLVEEPLDFSRAFLLNANGCDKEISPIPKERTRQ